MKQTKQMSRIPIVIQHLSNQVILMKTLFKFKKNKIRHSFSLFGFILSQFNLNVDDAASNFTQVSYGFLLLSLIALICFLNVIGYLITYILIQKGNYENKYPRLGKFINYYKKSTLLYVSVEAFLCLICLILMVFFSFLFVYSGIKT